MAKWLKFGLSAMSVLLALTCMASIAHAAITYSGDVKPTNPASWTSNTLAYIGETSNGTVIVNGGSCLLSKNGYVGYNNRGKTGTVTISGANSKWTNSNFFIFGYGDRDVGVINVAAGAQVSNINCYLAYSITSTATATITGTGSKWTNSNSLYVGHTGKATLMIDSGAEVSDVTGSIGTMPNSTGSVTVTGAGSKWTNSSFLEVGNAGSGTLNVEAGAFVSNTFCYLGYNYGSTFSVRVAGNGSCWTNNGNLFIGWLGIGELKIEAGGHVSNTNAYISYNSYGTSTVTVCGTGSQWDSNNLAVGEGGNATLNIGSLENSGGLVTAKKMWMSRATCNINNGGMLQVGSIIRGSGTADFNWNDGTIHNFDANTDLSISNANNLVLKLATTGTHFFNIDSNRNGTIDAILADATSDGTLNKIGAGALVLTAANTYSGATTVEDGRFEVTGSILNTSGITVEESGILELAKTSGSATAATLAIDNAGTILISAGSQSVGTITGTGITQVNAGATLTAHSIIQNTLSIGGTGAEFADMAETSSISEVPEPSALALLCMSGIGLIAYAWRQRKASPSSNFKLGK